jgi:hypothetical protein
MTPNAATEMIRNILTSPRTPPPGMTGAAGGVQIGGGLAGVASTAEKIGIKIYNDRGQYNEWEFVYDFSKDRTGAGMGAGALGNPAGNQQPSPSQQSGITPTGFNNSNTNQGFGSNAGGFGGAPGFGRQGGQTGFNSAPATPSTGSSGSFGGFLPSIGSSPAPSQPPSGQQPGKPPQPGQRPPNPNGPPVGISPPPPPPPPR